MNGWNLNCGCASPLTDIGNFRQQNNIANEIQQNTATWAKSELVCFLPSDVHVYPYLFSPMYTNSSQPTSSCIPTERVTVQMAADLKCWHCGRILSILRSSPEDLRHLLRHHRKRGQQRVAPLHGQRETRAVHFLETHNPIRWVFMPMLMNGREGQEKGLGWWMESGNEKAQKGSIAHGVRIREIG